MVAKWWDNGSSERSNRLHISGFRHVHYRLGYAVDIDTDLTIDDGGILDLQRLFALGIYLIINPLSLHEGLDIELIVVRDTQGDTLIFQGDVLVCADTLFEREVGVLVERRELGKDLSEWREKDWRAVGEELHIRCRVHLATGARHEPCVAFYMRVLLHVVEDGAHIVHLLLHIAWHRVPCAELGHPDGFAVLLKTLDIIFDCGRRCHVAVDSNSVDVVKGDVGLCKELIEPLDRVVIARERAIVHGRGDEQEVQLFRQSYHLWPMLSRLRRGHVALVGEVGFVEAKQILGIGVLLHVLANLGCAIGAIPTHRAEVHLVGVEPKGRGAVLVVSPVVGPRDSR